MQMTFNDSIFLRQPNSNYDSYLTCIPSVIHLLGYSTLS